MSSAKNTGPTIVSVEAMGENRQANGKPAVKAKGEWFMKNHDIHGVQVEGPYVNGDQFAVRFKMDMTFKETGNRSTMDEVGLYTIRDGKIAEERFLYAS